jgi:hypothetical protein
LGKVNTFSLVEITPIGLNVNLHCERSGVHADFLAERTKMMKDWADYLDQTLADYLKS